jgi:hypothetical protein
MNQSGAGDSEHAGSAGQAGGMETGGRETGGGGEQNGPQVGEQGGAPGSDLTPEGGSCLETRAMCGEDGGAGGTRNVAKPPLTCQGLLGFPGLPQAHAGLVPVALTSADFDADGALDLAVANREGETVSILLGLGNGQFKQPMQVPIEPYGAYLSSIQAADLNGDGMTDFAVAGAGSADIYVMLNRGDGTFDDGGYYTPGNIEAIAVGDVDGDDKPDIVACGYRVQVLLNEGDGSFAPAVTYAEGTNAIGVALADLNDDGRLDVALAENGADKLGVLLNGGNGKFGDPVHYPLGKVPYAVLSADLNGDGKPDLAVPTALSSEVDVLLNEGDHLAPAVPYFVGEGARSLTAGDVNGDGAIDLASFGGRGLAVLMNRGAGAFAPAVWYPHGGDDLALLDLTGDARPELIAPSADGHVSVLLNDGLEGFVTLSRLSMGERSTAVASVDLNDDTRADLVSSDVGGATVSVSFQREEGFSSAVTYPAGDHPGPVAPADLDADGDLDLVVPNADTDGVSILTNLGAGVFSEPMFVPLRAIPTAVLAVDLNDDDALDLVVVCQQDLVTLLLNQVDGSFGAPIDLPVTGNPTASAAGDLNGDGAPDLAIAGANSNSVSVLFNRGAGKFAEPVVYQVGYSPQALLVLDVDDDGVLELAVAEPSNGVEILHNDGLGGFERGPIYGEGAMAISSADLNGDGKVDLAVANSISASVLLNRGDGAFGEARYYPTGGTPVGIATSDLNGDGRVDVAVANSSMRKQGVSLLLNTCLE